MKEIILTLFVAAATILISFGQDTLKSKEIIPQSSLENKVGGHFGVLHYIIKSSGGKNDVIGNEFYEIGFPAGITIIKENFSFDIEMIPVIDRKSNVTLLFHPGVLFPLGNDFTFGTRAAFEIGQGKYGFTPLIKKSFSCSNGQVSFIEMIFPVRFSYNGAMTNIAGLNLGLEF